MNVMEGTRRGRTRLRAEVESELAALFARHSTTAQAYGAEFTHLWSLAARHVQGGKLIRPILLLETYDAVRRERQSWARTPHSAESVPGVLDRTQVVRVAAAVEMLHYAFLLHDDVIDGDVRRRGQLNLIGELAESYSEASRGRGTRHCADTGGILAGDLLLSMCHQVFARAELSAETRVRLLDLLEHTIIETTAGELVDVGLSDGVVDPDLSTVLAMTTRKTASYTFEFPLRAAAILAGASPQLESALSSAGSHLGLTFQLQDDLLSTFGDAALHGKDPFSDLREGKQTAIICFARMTSTWPALEADFGDPQLSEETGRRMRAQLIDCGAERFVKGLIDDQLTAFYEVLAAGDDSERIPAEVRVVLLDLVSRLEGRAS